ncbi:hypothetical protein D3C71_1204990 [compost metagenome]
MNETLRMELKQEIDNERKQSNYEQRVVTKLITDVIETYIQQYLGTIKNNVGERIYSFDQKLNVSSNVFADMKIRLAKEKGKEDFITLYNKEYFPYTAAVTSGKYYKDGKLLEDEVEDVIYVVYYNYGGSNKGIACVSTKYHIIEGQLETKDFRYPGSTIRSGYDVKISKSWTLEELKNDKIGSLYF